MNHSFNIEMAKRYGILEAVLLNHFLFWIEKNKANQKNFHDGRYWTYNSTKAFQELFPYASKRQIERALNHLRDEEILMVGNYNENKYDRTLWYAFTEKGESISRFGEMEITENVNGNDETVTPIPYTNTDTKTTYTNTDTHTAAHAAPHYDYEPFKTIFNETCTKLSKCRSITEPRKKAIRAYLKEYTLEQWQDICTNANVSDFLAGKNDRGWKADIDFLLRVDKATKVLEGGYANKDYRDRYKEDNGPEQTDDNETGFIFGW